MENRPVITLNARSPAPGADAKDFERYRKWMHEVYAPMLVNIPGVAEVDHYQIAKEHPEYPQIVSTQHSKNLKNWRAYVESPESIAIGEEVRSWKERGVVDYIWSAVYALLRSVRGKPSFSSGNEDTRIEGAPIMHLEAYRLSPEEQAKYVKWFNEYGWPIFIPLFMKFPGLMGYDWYEDTGLRWRQDVIMESEYPKYLSVIYFENLKAYDDFIKSPELSGFQKAMRSVLPRRLRYEWYVQYQLIKSWRK